MSAPMSTMYENTLMHAKKVLYSIVMCLVLNAIQISRFVVNTVPTDLQLPFQIIQVTKLFLTVCQLMRIDPKQDKQSFIAIVNKIKNAVINIEFAS